MRAVQRMSHHSFLFEEKESVCVPCAVLCACVCLNPYFGCKCTSLCLDMSHQIMILKQVVFLAVNVYRRNISLSWAVY